MKKSISLILILVLILGLCACAGENSSSGNNKKATITTLTGTTVQMTGKELQDAYRENMANFNALYNGANANITATVESVKTNQRYSGISTVFDEILCSEGWLIQLPSGHSYDLASLKKGSKISVSGSIYYGGLYINVSGITSFRVL